MAQLAVRNVQDQVVNILHPGLTVRSPTTSIGTFTVRGRLHQFSLVQPGAATKALVSMVGEPIEQVDWDHGTLAVARGEDRDPRGGLAGWLGGVAWEGEGFSAYLPLAGVDLKDVSIEAALDILTLFDPRVTPEGVVLSPRSPEVAHAATHPPMVVVQFDRIGILDVAPYSSASVRRPPPWQGTRTAAGELFKEQDSRGRLFYFLVAEPLLASVSPVGRLPEEEAMDLLGALQLRLTA